METEVTDVLSVASSSSSDVLSVTELAHAASCGWSAPELLDLPLRLERLLLRFGCWWKAFDTALEAGGARDVDLLLSAVAARPALLDTPSTKRRMRCVWEEPRTIGASELVEASELGNPEVVERLLRWWLRVPARAAAALGHRAIINASMKGCLHVVNCLLQVPGLDATAGNNSAIRWASAYGHVGVVERLLQVQCDATACHNFAIQWASRNGYIEVVERLLQVPGVDASDGGNCAIIWASEHGHYEVVNLLLKVPGVDATAEDNEAVRLASREGHLWVVELLLRVPGVKL